MLLIFKNLTYICVNKLIFCKVNKTILVPTDFSENAHIALNYAIGMAKEYQYDIHLIHAFQAMTSKFGDETFNKEITDHAETKALQQLELLRTEKQAAHPEVNFSKDCLEGSNLSEVLTSISGKSNYLLIVMGTKGSTGMKDRLLGSNTFNTIIKAPIPVLAIPEEFGRFSMSRAGLLTNFKKTDIPLLESFTEIFGRNTEITLLHVLENNGSDEESDLISWKEHLESQTGLSGFRWKIDSVSPRLDVDESLPDCIHDMAEEAKLEILLVHYNTKSFFKRIFSKSLVRNFAHQIHRPVFFYKE